MKHSNKLDQKFNNQLNHMQGFIGMPNWNSPSFEEKKHEYSHRKLKAKQARDRRERIASLLINAYKLLNTKLGKALNKKPPVNAGAELSHCA